MSSARFRPVAVGSAMFYRNVMLFLRSSLVAGGLALAGAASSIAQTQPTQLDRIEQKLDTILRRLDQLQTGAGSPTASPATPGSDASAPDTLAAGALAIVHAAPATPIAAREVPPDTVGGFVYTGGPLQLADLSDRGVRYTGLAGV